MSEWFSASPGDLVTTCVRRITELDCEIHAWVDVAPQEALGEGPLQGIPFGVKDIFETRNLSTEYGSEIYAGRKGERDAALVTDLRRRGAILLGKTQTTAFAYFDPGPTRNPRNLQHTPGGSSSGSAAAVACGMAAFALGTQTQGSVLRPASFCGVVGFKPSFGVLSLDGVLPFAPSLDTAGLFTQTVSDLRTLWSRMGFDSRAVEYTCLGVPEPLPAVDPAMRQAFEDSLLKLKATGFQVQPVELPCPYTELVTASRIINEYEGARTHRERWLQYGSRVGCKLAELIKTGLMMPDSLYRSALETLRLAKQQMRKFFGEFPFLLTPAALGPAPLGLESTGDPRMNSGWTALGVPAISVPMPVGNALPLGLQIIAAPGKDTELLELAAIVSTVQSGSAGDPAEPRP